MGDTENVRQGGNPTKSPIDPSKLRKETRDLLTRTIHDTRSIAADLANAGEDVRGLLQAIDSLERFVEPGTTKRLQKKGTVGPRRTHP
jgi:hypothetical protein